jgi:hypothetical protein
MKAARHLAVAGSWVAAAGYLGTVLYNPAKLMIYIILFSRKNRNDLSRIVQRGAAITHPQCG